MPVFSLFILKKRSDINLKRATISIIVKKNQIILNIFWVNAKQSNELFNTFF